MGDQIVEIELLGSMVKGRGLWRASRGLFHVSITEVETETEAVFYWGGIK